MNWKLARGRARAGWPRRGKIREAFTLIELLVVIAVIALLAALLLPALNRAKEQGYGAVCKSNLHQLGLALANYVSDLGAYPIWVFNTIPNNSDRPTTWWTEELEPYSKASWGTELMYGRAEGKSRLYLCPSYARVIRPRSPEWTGSLLWSFSHEIGPYGYNAFGPPLTNSVSSGLGLGGIPGLGGMVKPTRESEVVHPSRMVAIGDALIVSGGSIVDGSTYLQEGFYVYSLLISNDASPGTPLMRSALGRRHGGKWNMVFCDAHVDTLGTRSLFDATDDAVLALWSKDGLAHR